MILLMSSVRRVINAASLCNKSYIRQNSQGGIPRIWGTIVTNHRGLCLTRHTIRRPQTFVLCHSIVSAVELHFRNFVVALDTSSLLKARGNIGVNFSEYSNLALENLLVGADLHLPSDIVGEARLCCVVKDLLPQRLMVH